jgi:hemolysin III
VRRVPQSRGEEIANSVSHGVGFVAALAGIPLLVIGAANRGDAGDIVGGAVFGAALALLYLTSTLYHAVPSGPTKQVLRKLDHSAIFLLIAGTYTPFTLGVLGGAWGWTLFGLAWGIAIIGILLKVFAGIRHTRLSSALYLGMGWMVVVAIRPLITQVPAWGIGLLVAGGLAYTVGVVFYAAPRLRYAHFVWHLFVLTGSTCHFFAVLWYAV